jgi:hypothetical protein
MFVAHLQFVLPLQCRAEQAVCVEGVDTACFSCCWGWGVLVQFPRVMCKYIPQHSAA